MTLFITIKFLDIVDILLVSLLLYQFYMLIKGTVAINIFVAIFSIYLFWLIVKALNMQLLSTILGQVIGVGIIALIIVFQQEIRRFLLMIGTRYMSKQFSLQNLILTGRDSISAVKTKAIARACANMSKSKTGALIVLARNSALHFYADTGEIINANTTTTLIETIFFKNNLIFNTLTLNHEHVAIKMKYIFFIHQMNSRYKARLTANRNKKLNKIRVGITMHDLQRPPI